MISRLLIKAVLLFFLMIFFLINTDIGLLIIIKFLPGKANVSYASGSFLKGWEIKNFTYKDDAFQCSIERIQFQWNWHELLKKNLWINNIKIQNMSLKISDASSNTKTGLPLPRINIPLNIHLGHSSLKNVIFINNNNDYFFNEIRLSGSIENNLLSINKADIENNDFYSEIHGFVNVNNFSNMNIDNKTLIKSYQNTTIKTHIEGNTKSLNLDITSSPWLNIHVALSNHLNDLEKIIVHANWFVDTKKAHFAKLENLNGKLQIQGNADGSLFQLKTKNTLLAKNLKYDNFSIGFLKSYLSLTLDKKHEIQFSLEGENIISDENLLNDVKASITGDFLSHKINVHLHALNNSAIDFSSTGSYNGKKSYSLKNGYANLNPLNLILSPIQFELQLNTQHEALYHLTLLHGQEKLQLNGKTSVDMANPLTQLTLITEKFTLVNTEAYKIIAQSNLSVEHNNASTKLKGQATILEANIRPADFSNTITVSPDIVYVNNQNERIYHKSEPLNLFMNVDLFIKELNIQYLGLTALIQGKIQLIDMPSVALAGSGQLSVKEGSYNAYGQTLTIEQGSHINFIHDLSNPQLMITASKKISVSPAYMTLPTYQPYLIAGVKISGTSNLPIITLYSDPAGISQQDILSYLLFGYPQNQLTNSQANALWSAFTMINNNQNSYGLSSLQKSIKTELGFSEFGLGNTSEFNAATGQYESGTAFVIGKRITDNLTATYNVGLLVPVNILYLRYQLSPSWSLQSDSSALGNGGDIFYTIRRD